MKEGRGPELALFAARFACLMCLGSFVEGCVCVRLRASVDGLGLRV